MNISNKPTFYECTSCQMCAAICHANAITIQLDNDGFYRPYINNDKCNNCGLCTQVCYKYDCEIEKNSNKELNQYTLYAASAKSEEIVANTTSGGIADLLAKQLIIDGYKVIGVIYDYESNKAKHKIASTIEETLPFRGSKYIQSYSVEALREFVLQCRNQKYAIFGLPCQIYAISRFLKKKGIRQQCILIDLYCHGCPSMHVWNKTIEKIHEKIGSSPFDEVNFRSKKRGWGEFVIKVKKGDKCYFSTPLKNEFFDLFFSNQVLNPSCENCQLRSTLSYTDIRLGDFWGKKYRDNFRGVSGVTIVSEKAKELFTKIAPSLNYHEETLDSFLPFQSWGHSYIINEELRNKLMNLLKDEKTTIKDVIKPIYQKRRKKVLFTNIIKSILFFLPSKIYYALRNY